MKRIITAAAALALLLSGCGAKTAPPPSVDRQYSCTAEITFGENELSAEVERRGSGLWSFTMTEPSTVSGISLIFNGEDVTASYLGLSFSVPQSAVPAKNCILAIIEAIDNTALSEQSEQGLSYISTDDGYTIAGETELGAYTLKLTPDGALSFFEMPSQSITVKFQCFEDGTTPPETGTEATSPESAPDSTQEETTSAESDIPMVTEPVETVTPS